MGMYLYDRHVDINVARVISVGRNGGMLVPVQEGEIPERSTHSSDNLWVVVGELPLGNYQDPEAAV